MRRSLVLTAVLAVTVVAWCATIKGVILAASIVDELDRAKVLANLLPRPQATIVYDRYDRKIREILLAAEIEQRYTKTQILEQYLNTVYLGDGYYGVEAAAQGYFGKPASALEPHEAALLAALVRSPSSDTPSIAPQRAL